MATPEHATRGRGALPAAEPAALAVPAGVPHAGEARERFKMLLMMFRG